MSNQGQCLAAPRLSHCSCRPVQSSSNLQHRAPEIEGVRTPSPTTMAVAIITVNSSATCKKKLVHLCQSLHMCGGGFRVPTPPTQHQATRLRSLAKNCRRKTAHRSSARTCSPLLRMYARLSAALLPFARLRQWPHSPAGRPDSCSSSGWAGPNGVKPAALHMSEYSANVPPAGRSRQVGDVFGRTKS